ncbi:type I-C CRISPR-associated protein Cas8c/Csd1 [Sulfuriferula plumbiphila]|uniref:Type I-C CRISPR-associated protein Cas8c/Csd1 n=1 Tax=Sulfuriferula plumbiphila TaxID=171865 RepID=A0A512L791_9PROT|nr:type I-C CRISPR-associated protein Cas8c/Csd1 [Sulfuriferula plumbiphila]BBP05279.1 type I-C CRISPR-associated protein Cas8c/Csd1 [Sulfuriferula plumbiphila]GEP30317.1 type I-C CRISPR-associated protein Cas8c/Csd1 [Sulfuriferula plumbiphila]
MILQSLHEYYGRKRDSLPGDGIERKELPFLFVLKPDGAFLHIEDTRQGEGKRKRGNAFLVPQGVKKSVNVAANLLWGNVEYVIGQPDSKKLEEQRKKGKEKHYRERLGDMCSAFRTEIEQLPSEVKSTPEVAAVLAFLSSGNFTHVLADPLWPQVSATGANVSFKLTGAESPVCSASGILASVGQSTEDKGETRICLITGNSDVVERLHPPIKGVWGAQTSGANIVSFNLSAFNSFAREQGSNAPVGKRAAFAYTTALNHLLVSKQRIQIGDASTVFWAAEDNKMESLLSQFFDEPPQDNPDQGTNAVKELLEATLAGTPAIYDDGTRFYVLGLAPNAARIAVRFWHVATVGDLAGHIRQHFEDLEIVRPQYVERPFLSLKALLLAVSPLGDLDKLPPKLAGDFMKAILDGTSYPQTLLQAALRRIHAEQAKKDEKTGKHRDHVPYARAALIKAWLNRQTRNANPDQERKITMSLDESNINSGYRLGRLFAVLEKVQAEANPGLNTTIRDSYFGSASSTPSAVFPTLMRRNQHHMTKLRKEKPGLYVTRDKLIQTICNDGIDGQLGFRPILSLADQGRFVIGYYQQRQDLFTKS